MNNTQFTDAQIAAFTKAAEVMRHRGWDYWPYSLKGLSETYGTPICLYSMEDDSIWLVDTNNSVSMRDATKIQLILGAPSK